MIQVNELVPVFKRIIGWPYVSPGSNNAQGIDCSGAFVYSYRQFGKSIYHGSNRIIRKYCHDVKTISSVSQLRVGMAIFKSRTDVSRMKAEYKPGGEFYDPALPYDYYHIGLVTSVSPLEITNATTPVARVDTVLSKWCCAGYLNAVDYSGVETGGGNGGGETGGNGTGNDGDALQAIVNAPSGGTVNLRGAPSRGAAVLVRVPLGQTVTVLSKTNADWWQVQYQKPAQVNDVSGYMMKEFLEPVDNASS